MKQTKKNRFYRTKIYSDRILKVRVDGVSLKKALSLIEKSADSNKQYQITTPNPEHIVLAQSDYRFRNILNNSSLSIADGIGLVWAAKLLKRDFQNSNHSVTLYRLSGIDLMLAMCKLAAKKNWRVFLLGGKKRAAKNTALKLKIKYQIPKTHIKNSKTKKINNKTMKQYNNVFKIAYDEGSKSIINETTKEQQRIIRKINNFKPHFLFVAYGAPMQEKWIAKNLPKLKVKIAMGVGGAFDYLSGRVKHAPKIVREIGLEWLWRLILEPWRWRRQLSLIKFIFLVLKEKFV